MENVRIRPAVPADAPLIGTAVVEAIGADHCVELGHGRYSAPEAVDFFARMAARPDTQYSYLNTLVAEDPTGAPVGVCVAYDGARLQELREVFFLHAVPFMGLDPSAVPDETDSSEFYLDSLWVSPSARGRGIASRLIEATAVRAAQSGKPLGLLCDPANRDARRLYDRVGFKPVGPRFFLGIPMDHLQLG